MITSLTHFDNTDDSDRGPPAALELSVILSYFSFIVCTLVFFVFAFVVDIIYYTITV